MESSDDEEEYEESGGGTRLFGFMFGNVDNSGDLDADYLDEDAKGHLDALAVKLSSELKDIELTVKSPQASADTAEQDYDEKNEDAVDYEDMDEPYEGPEVQPASEEDYLLPKKEYFSSEVSLATLKRTASVFDDENYDEDEEEHEKEQDSKDAKIEVQTVPSSGSHICQQDIPVIPESGKALGDDTQFDSLETENLDAVLEDFQEEDVDANMESTDANNESTDAKGVIPLPILYTEGGTVILRFSEIFGVNEPLKKGEKRDHRYPIVRERYVSQNLFDIIEDDEEAFLKGSCQVFSSMHGIRHDISDLKDDDTEFAEYSLMKGGSQTHSQIEKQSSRTCVSAEPMKTEIMANLSLESQFKSKLYPLDQQDWEDRILWDDHSVVNRDFVGRSDDNLDAKMSFSNEAGKGFELNSNYRKLGENDDKFFFQRSPVLLESFDSGDSLRDANSQLLESQCHPQHLRLESRLEADKHNHNDLDGEDNDLELHQSDAVRRFSNSTFLNREFMDGSWLDDIIWEPQLTSVKPKLIFDLQDERMLFEILDNRDSEHVSLHAGAMIISRASHPDVSFERHGYHPSWQFNIANDKFYRNRKIPQQLQPNSNKRTAYGMKVHHAAPAVKLQTMKLKLSNKDLAHFHRPKALWYPHDNEVAVKEQGKLPTVGPMKIIIKSMGGKGSKLHVDAEETVTSVKAKASKKLDFKPPETVKLYYLGKELEDDKSLAAQGVPPNSLLHLVRTKLHVWPRAQKIPGENKSLRPPGAFKKKSDLSVKDGHVFLMEYCEERPLLLSNAGMGANLRTYYQKSSPSDQTGNALRTGNSSLGSVVVLEPTDKSPFLGDIKAGCHQSSLETNMYKAPIFPHRVQSTDYLLVRSAKGKLSIRRIDRIAVVGQQEPLMEVLTPGSKNLQTYILNRLLVYVYREFRAAEKRGVVPWIRADELSTQFPNLSDTIIRKKLKECAVLRKDANGHLFWSKKRDFSIPSEEDLKKFVLPENVCSHESMQAGLYRLKHLGITRLTLPTSISNAMSQIPDEAIALAAASHIERELQITPWNLSSNFVACTNHDRENIERLEITGVGDPSGRGLGFSYVRAAPKAPVSNSMVKKKAAAGRGGSTVTGTDADLRRLSMEAAREVLLKFNVPDEQIAKQTRWHRIAMIRKLSSEQAESGVKVDPSTISKYARGQRMSFLQLQQQTREKCQEIWDRQVQSLSAVDGDENESDSEANSDLDSFAGDLENLLDAEEFEVDDGTSESKHDKVDGVKGIKMRRRPLQTQAEEEIEDEAAEAAELCRLLMEADDEEDQKKNKKSKGETGLVPSSKPPISAGNLDRVKKMNKAQPIVSYFPKESWTRDSIEGERSFGKKKSDKMKMMKKTGTPSTTQIKTKVKILGDGLQIFKPKKSSRESFVCGACGQLGHMRTNKHCPRYREDIEIPVETTDPEKTSGKPTSLDSSIKSQQKMQKKKAASKVTKEIEAPEGENISAKAKVLPVKFKHDNNPVEGVALSSEQPMTSSAQPASSDIESGSRSGTKINKIIISNKSKPEDTKLESHKPTIVIKPPMDTDKGETESHRPSIVIRPPASMDRGQVESHKPSIVIRPPADKEKEQTHKKIVFKRTKEIIDLDQVSQDGSTDFEYRKTKRIVELSSLEKHGKLEIFGGDSSLRRTSEQNRWWKDEEKRRKAGKSREMSIYEERMGFDEREGIAELRRYEETIRRDREEEERLKAKKKKKKKVRPEISDDYLEDYGAKRNDRRDRGVKRRPLGESPRYSTEYNPAAKRRRGGEVGLANVLERIVDTLRESREVSYLFLKPVSKKEAPDYLDIVERPMDLSTIKNKVRKMEYKNREEFRHDVAQITINAHLYNDGRNPGIPPLADQLLEICDYLLEEHHHSLSEAEAGI